MPRGRKRKLDAKDASGNQSLALPKHDTPVKKDLLQQHYPIVCTLREHVLSSLPDTSKTRRKKIAALGSSINASAIEVQLARVLDSALVGTSPSTPKSESNDLTWQQWLSFSQKGDESNVTISKGIASSIYTQSEIVDFVIWKLFSKERAGSWPKHILCDGFRRSARDDQSTRSNIHGISIQYPNFHVKALREAPWPHLLALLGQAGERVMINLLSECSVFLKIDAGLDNYLQLTGIPLSELETKAPDHTLSRKLSDITLVRSRIFYAKPATTAKGLVQAGFKHIHALNRHPYSNEALSADKDGQESKDIRRQNEAHTTRLMMYIFPRQFGLHNVFTSAINTNQTAQKFHDYTLREDEINKKMRASKDSPEKSLPKLPKRLRSSARDLVRRLQILHARCSYFELLKHYCPTFLDGAHGSKKKAGILEPSGISSSVPGQATQTVGPQSKRRTRRNPVEASVLPEYKSLVELACPVACVSAFCQATLSKIIPDNFWGSEKDCHNKSMFLRKIDHFIKLRRFEMISLHEIVQDFKVTELAWLVPPACEGQKTSRTDMNKRYQPQGRNV
ncbi:Telomerase ribonucleoprotein complex RNA binding domain-containing protein [Trichoderma chlorosporum]